MSPALTAVDWVVWVVGAGSVLLILGLFYWRRYQRKRVRWPYWHLLMSGALTLAASAAVWLSLLQLRYCVSVSPACTAEGFCVPRVICSLEPRFLWLWAIPPVILLGYWLLVLLKRSGQ